MLDPHESMAMFAQSLTLLIGAEGRAGGAITTSIDMQTYFQVGDTLNEDHSPQFDKPIQFNGVNGVKACYEAIIDKLQVQ